MYFSTKNYLKNNHNHTAKHTLNLHYKSNLLCKVQNSMICKKKKNLINSSFIKR